MPSPRPNRSSALRPPLHHPSGTPARQQDASPSFHTPVPQQDASHSLHPPAGPRHRSTTLLPPLRPREPRKPRLGPPPSASSAAAEVPRRMLSFGSGFFHLARSFRGSCTRYSYSVPHSSSFAQRDHYLILHKRRRSETRRVHTRQATLLSPARVRRRAKKTAPADCTITDRAPSPSGTCRPRVRGPPKVASPGWTPPGRTTAGTTRTSSRYRRGARRRLRPFGGPAPRPEVEVTHRKRPWSPCSGGKESNPQDGGGGGGADG